MHVIVHHHKQINRGIRICLWIIRILNLHIRKPAYTCDKSTLVESRSNWPVYLYKKKKKKRTIKNTSILSVFKTLAISKHCMTTYKPTAINTDRKDVTDDVCSGRIVYMMIKTVLTGISFSLSVHMT